MAQLSISTKAVAVHNFLYTRPIDFRFDDRAGLGLHKVIIEVDAYTRCLRYGESAIYRLVVLNAYLFHVILEGVGVMLVDEEVGNGCLKMECSGGGYR